MMWVSLALICSFTHQRGLLRDGGRGTKSFCQSFPPPVRLMTGVDLGAGWRGHKLRGKISTSLQKDIMMIQLDVRA